MTDHNITTLKKVSHIETITVFGQTGFIAPGGTMNVYLGGVIVFFWVTGVVRWAFQQIDSAGQHEKKQMQLP
jgi:hypothetical protein